MQPPPSADDSQGPCLNPYCGGLFEKHRRPEKVFYPFLHMQGFCSGHAASTPWRIRVEDGPVDVPFIFRRGDELEGQ